MVLVMKVIGSRGLDRWWWWLVVHTLIRSENLLFSEFLAEWKARQRRVGTLVAVSTARLTAWSRRRLGCECCSLERGGRQAYLI